MASNPTAQDPTAWLGNTARCEDRLAPVLVDRIAATFGQTPLPAGAALPLLWHWAFFQEPVVAEGIGEDGHPARGGFLPPADNRNRMWAGSRLRFVEPLRVDTPAVRESEIIAIKEKQGRTGSLLFVTVAHRYHQDGRLAIDEEQDIVYREPSPPKLSLDRAVSQSQWHETITPDPVFLFRYSAVTFNAHRIHYDWPYVTEAEGYPGLVVHGPLVATLLIRAFCNAHPNARVDTFSFRGLRPLVAPKPFDVCGRIESTGSARLWAHNDDGPAQEAELTFTEI
ncbi:MaoC family dehydratase N-terminal domain-containing protein [Salinisphaera sp. T31B1]|uniref:FAS1-like dehydratase domain-containing protein n=1 Tax=Salinisphaera sp. T31B1 TaxID=727963 RepID=UPI00333E90AD